MIYGLRCEYCGDTQTIDGNNVPPEFTEMPQSLIPSRWNGTNDTVELPKKYRCLNCGRAYRIWEAQKPVEAKQELEKPQDRPEPPSLEDFERKLKMSISSTRKPMTDNIPKF